MKPIVKYDRLYSLVVCIGLMCCAQVSADDPLQQPTIERLADLPITVAGGALIELSDNRLAYAGGTTWADGKKHWLSDVFIYDVAKDVWTAGPPLPESVDASLPLPIRIDGQWMLVGGETEHDIRRRSITLTEQGSNLHWQLTQVLPFGKAAAAGGVVGNQLVVVGGADVHKGYGQGDATVWIARRSECEDNAWVWSQEANYPGRAHSIAASAVYNDRLYVFGGFYVDNGAPLNTDEVFCYTPDEGWQEVEPLPAACRAATAVAVQGVGIVFAGGWGDSQVSRDVWLYQPDADAYQHIGTLPVPLAAASGLAVGRDVYLAGNENQPASRQHDFFLLRFSDHQ